MDTHIRII